MVNIGVEIFSDENIKKIFFIKARISNFSPVDLIIGRPTIKKLNLLKHFPSHFSPEIKEEMRVTKPDISTPPQKSLKRKIDNTPSWQVSKIENKGSTPPSPTSERARDLTEDRHIITPNGSVSCCVDHHLSMGVASPNERVCRCPLSPTVKRVTWAQKRVAEKCDGETHTTSVPTDGDIAQTMAATITESTDTYSRQVLAPDEIDDEKVDTFGPFLPNPVPNTAHFLDLITTEGDELFQHDIRSVCSKYEHIFRDTLGEFPARIPPFVINVDKKEWEVPKNKGPPRPQTALKEKLITDHITTMLASGVIETPCGLAL